MSIILLVILIAFQTVVSVTDARDIKRQIVTDTTEKIRLKFYKEAIIWGWIPVGIIFLFVTFTSMSWRDIGFRSIALSDYKWLNITVLAITGIMAGTLIYQIAMFFFSEKYRKDVAKMIDDKINSGNHYDKVTLGLLIPHTLKEKVWFLFVSLTAGICEEIHLRGCIMFLLSDIFPHMLIAVIGIIAALLFGFFHCYQGLSGVIKTSIAGMLFVALYLATDSIVPGIILHFLVDFSSAFLINDRNKT